MARDWVEVFVWTGHDEGSSHSTGWELQYLPRIYPPCVVHRLDGYLTKIKVPGFGLMLSEDKNNSARRCACMPQTPLGVFSAGRILLTLIGCRACVGGSVNCSDWLRLDCVVDFSPGGVWIDYIRPGLEVTHLLCFVRLPGRVLYCWILFILDILWYGLCLARWMSVVPPEG